MKVYLLIHTYTDFPTEIEVYDSRVKAEIGFYKAVGLDIMDAIRNDDREYAIKSIEKMQIDDNDIFYLNWGDEELYIEEKEIM